MPDTSGPTPPKAPPPMSAFTVPVAMAVMIKFADAAGGCIRIKAEEIEKASALKITTQQDLDGQKWFVIRVVTAEEAEEQRKGSKLVRAPASVLDQLKNGGK